MHNVSAHDRGREIDWGKASSDYATHRPNYPARFFEELASRGVGLPGQHILDLGTGVGFLANQFARQGAQVTGNDIAEGQIAEARLLAEAEGLNAEYIAAATEALAFEGASFDHVTASQCWLYFDRDLMVPRGARWLKPGGRLVTSHFCWLPREDESARATEALMLKHNPDWTAADYTGAIPDLPNWAQDRDDVRVVDKLVFDADVPFTHESWRGRIRASRAISATLALDAVEAFDRDLAALLAELDVAQQFTVKHRIDAHFFELG